MTARIASVWSDARRATTPGTIGDDLDRSGQIVGESILTGGRRAYVPSGSDLSIAIDGPGWFVFDDDGRREYGRLGDFRVDARGTLVDGAGRAVLGHRYASDGSNQAGLMRIRIGGDGARVTPDEISIDGRGVVSATLGGKSKPVAQIALAIFAAPERLMRSTETTVKATAAAGSPVFEYPGAANVGTLRAHELESGMVDLQGDLAELWRAGRRADTSTASAYADDACMRAALELVK